MGALLWTSEFTILHILAAICCTLWTYAYIAIIRIGIKDKTCGMPIEALAFNFAWEILFGIVWFLQEHGENPQVYVNILWSIFDIGILCTFFWYGATRGMSDIGFKRYGAAFVLAAFAILGAGYYYDYPDIEAFHAITAWLVNGVMSYMFIRMLWNRGTAGQTLKIAWAKALATFAVTVAYTLPQGALLFKMYDLNYPVIIATGWICFAFDLTYVFLLSRAIKSENKRSAVNHT